MKTAIRPVLLVSNSSWYLFHYRKLLIKKIKKKMLHILALAPIDSSSSKLSELLIHIPWRMSRVQNQNIISGLISFIRMLLIVRAIKPKLIHSHTLQANLISSLVCSLFGINCVLSFAGIGRFSNSKNVKKIIFFIIFKIICLFSSYQRSSKYCFKYNPRRSIFIFQNKEDFDFINSNILGIKNINTSIIPGSGLPSNYIDKKNLFLKNKFFLDTNQLKNTNKKLKLDFIYCARLLRSKGILKFLKLSKIYSSHNFWVFGSIDNSSKDSITDKNINIFKSKYKNVSFMNNKKDPLLNSKFDYPVLITPSIYGEGFPRGIIEANALHIPVVSSINAANKISIKNLTYISKDDKVESYVLCIEKLLSDYKLGLLTKKLKDSREKVINNFSEELIVEQTLEIYKKLENENLSYLLTKDNDKIKNWIAK